MAKRKRTVEQLLDRLAEATDFPQGFTANSYVTQTRAIEYLSDSVHAFSQKHQAFGLLHKTDTINAVSGTKSYALPDDFAALLNLTYESSGRPKRLYRAESVNQIDLESTYRQGWNESRALYVLLGDELITTDPKGSYTVTIRYVPELPMFDSNNEPIADFSQTTDYILAKGSVDQWVVLDSAIKILRKQQIDPSAQMLARDELEQQLLLNLTDRDAMEPRFVRNEWDSPHRRWGDD